MTDTSHAQSSATALAPVAIDEVLNQSLTQKKGLSIHIAGQVDLLPISCTS